MKTILLAISSFALVGCGSVTMEQLQDAHNIYHIVTGKPCSFAK